MSEAVVEMAPSRASSLKPQTSVAIAVDTAYVAAQQGRNISQGVYMMDNRLRNGSAGEGNLELTTVCNDGDLIGFNVVPINALGTSGDEVVITGFNVRSGSVFTAAGEPRQETSPKGEQPGQYWIGQALNQGEQTYEIQIEVTVGQLQPVSYFVNWDPFIHSK